jgi:hypothetical protein
MNIIQTTRIYGKQQEQWAIYDNITFHNNIRIDTTINYILLYIFQAVSFTLWWLIRWMKIPQRGVVRVVRSAARRKNENQNRDSGCLGKRRILISIQQRSVPCTLLSYVSKCIIYICFHLKYISSVNSSNIDVCWHPVNNEMYLYTLFLYISKNGQLTFIFILKFQCMWVLTSDQFKMSHIPSYYMCQNRQFTIVCISTFGIWQFQYR